MLIHPWRSRLSATAARPSSSSSMLAAAIGLALASAAAGAQTASSEQDSAPQAMPKVSVQGQTDESSYKAEKASSPKFTQPLLDTPQTITVINKQLMQDQAAATLSDAMQNSPGITFTLGENGNTTTGDSVFMRGFDTSGSIFLDGIRDLGTVSRDVFNIEQIEVVKGPSGPDNGRGAPTGYINMSSKVPALQDSASSILTVGTDDRRRVTADWNQSFVGGLESSALRLNAMYDEGDRLGRDVARTQRWGLAPSFAIGLDTSTRAYFNYFYTKQDNIPDGGISAIGIADYNPSAFGGIAPAPVKLSNYYGALSDFDHVEANMVTLRLEHDFSASTTVRNTSRYGRLTEQYVLTGVNAITTPVLANPSTWTVARNRQGKDQINDILTNQTNLTTAFNTGFLSHTVSTGLEFIYERQNNLVFAASATAPLANLYNPSTADIFAAVLPTGASNDGKTTTAAVYVFDTLKFNEQWSLNGGLRLERFETQFTGIAAPTTPPTASTLLEKSDNSLTGKLGAVFKPLPNGSIYLAYANSQRPPGSTNFTLSATTTNADNANLDPQEAANIELGTKWEVLDNQLVLTAAVFDTRNKNDQSAADPNTGEIDQYGEKRVRGVELGASGMITPNWQISAGVAKMDTEVTEGSITTPSQQGAQINFSPEFTFTSWTTYRLPFGLTIGGGARFVDSQMTAVNNDTASVVGAREIPSYWVVDLVAAYDINERIGLQFNAKNLTNEFYIASVNNGRSRYTLGAPRSAQLAMSLKF